MYSKLLITFLFIFSISCSSDPTNFEHDENQQLTNINWELKYFYLNSGRVEAIEPGDFTLLFNETNTITGRVDCNDCGFEYTLKSDNSISIEPGNCTFVYCGPQSKDKDFMKAIKMVSEYKINETGMRLYYDYSYLHFEKQQ